LHLDGEEIEFVATPSLPTSTSCLYPKEDRAKLRADERRDIVEDAIKKVFSKFKPQALQVTDSKESKDGSLLEDEANLSSLIASVRERHRNYDIHTVFKIVFPSDPNRSPDLKKDGAVPLTLDLYRQYTSVTPEQVAVSNFWYSSWTDHSKQPWHRENLHLTYLMLVNHTVSELHHKVMETYTKYPPQYHGGPLYFKLVMDALVADLERVSSAILKHMTDYKIRDSKGEDVSWAVTLLRNGCDRLYSVHRLPQEMPRILVKVYQTTSSRDFNKLFELLELDMRRAPTSVTRNVFAIHNHLFQNSDPCGALPRSD
jgi:hypothetical protein